MDESCWRQTLIEAHRELFVRSFRGVPFSPGFPICSDGWQHIIERLVDRVFDAVQGCYPVYFTHILEQHGVLRVHWTSPADLPTDIEFAIQEAIALAEARSASTCAVCGEEGRLFSHGSRLFTACPTHALGISVPLPRGFHNTYVGRAIVGGRSALVSRRYDWASDSFVDLQQESERLLSDEGS